ncbi:hypothetical protein K445DRAFT_373472 [Daldinia sp. EC12]|nr:hypothetical protein K445DRAFT_373472 [Daldinia sp. EC12]
MSQEKARKKGRTPLPDIPSPRPVESWHDNQVKVQGPKAPLLEAPEAKHEPQILERSPPRGLLCDACGVVLASMSTLRQHKRTVHIGTRCHWGTCTQTFETTKHLISHLLDHQRRASTGENSDYLVCHWPDCGDRKADKGEMNRHIRMHNGFIHYAHQ